MQRREVNPVHPKSDALWGNALHGRVAATFKSDVACKNSQVRDGVYTLGNQAYKICLASEKVLKLDVKRPCV